MKARRIFDAIKLLSAFDLFDAVHFDGARLERAYACCDIDGFSNEASSDRGLDVEPSIVATLDHGHFLPQMKDRIERLDLLHQVVGQYLPNAYQHNKKNEKRFVWI